MRWPFSQHVIGAKGAMSKGFPMSTPYIVSSSAPIATASATRLLQSAIAACLGLMIVGFVGFSHIEIVHNAAHDTRHANAFPCH
jgi:cobalt transporter subunit CbtB